MTDTQDKHFEAAEFAKLADAADLEEIQQTLTDVEAQIREVVREHPLLSLGAAVVAGYAFGRVISRR